MIAICQFCKEMVRGPESSSLNVEARRAWEYRQLSMLVSAHMVERHSVEAGNEIMIVTAMAGAAVAMRFVSSADPLVDEWRNNAGEALMEAFHPAPPAPLASLGEDQAAGRAASSADSSAAPSTSAL
jgi:hypothetical protein